jgi:hypothetical protein
MWHAWERREMDISFGRETPKERDCLENLNEDGKMILIQT